MHLHLKKYLQVSLLLGGLHCIGGSAAAQTDALTGPPNSRGFAPGGAGTNLESINPISGILGLTIPLAQLPPGPGGLTAGVSLVYNSNIYDIPNNVIAPTVVAAPWRASTHGGGWNYGYKYTLWSQPRAANLLKGFLGTTQCSSFPAYEQTDWYKTFLLTPDGGNHVLQLVSAINPDGSMASIITQDSSDMGSDYYAYDFSGHNNGCKPGSSFSGTLIYATIDDTYIRVEANTSSLTWTAYLPDGSRASGPIVEPNSTATDSDATSYVDRNSNAVVFGGDCQTGTSCLESITDLQGRHIQIQYEGQSDQGWTDLITWPGANGLLTTYVNWQNNSPVAISEYPCIETIDPNQAGPVQSSCNSLPTSMVVNSVQLPAAKSGGNAMIYAFGYGVPSGQQSWGELHSVLKCADASVASNLGAQQIGALCTTSSAQYYLQYSYVYDGPVFLNRWFGVPLNSLVGRTLNYSQKLNGSSSQIAESTTYSPLSAIFPYSPPSGVSTVTQSNGVVTEYYTSASCSGTVVNTPDYCEPTLYKVVSGSNTTYPTTTELAWSSGITPSGGVGMMNPYVNAVVVSVNGVAKETEYNEDVNGNNTFVGELDWFNAAKIPRTGGMFVGGAPSFPIRSRTAIPSSSSAYWNTGNGFLRGLGTVAVNNVTPTGSTAGVEQSTYTYDGHGNLIALQLQDLAQGGATISRSWTYLSNGNLWYATDPNGNRTQINYDAASLYPVSKVTNTNTSSPLRTYSYTFDSCGSGVLLSQGDDNNVTTTYTYDDLGRQKTAVQTNGDVTRTTSTNIDDVGMSVATTSDVLPGQTTTVTAYYDALGRLRSSVDSAGNQVQAAAQYGTAGSLVSYELSSNPSCAGSSNCDTTVDSPNGRLDIGDA